MTEPASGVFGFKVATILAGFFGGVVSLSFIKELTKAQATIAVLTGMLVAAYAAPALADWIGLSPKIESLLGFVFGLTAMNIIPGVLKLAKAFREDPGKFVKWPGKSDGGDKP